MIQITTDFSRDEPNYMWINVYRFSFTQLPTVDRCGVQHLVVCVCKNNNVYCSIPLKWNLISLWVMACNTTQCTVRLQLLKYPLYTKWTYQHLECFLCLLHNKPLAFPDSAVTHNSYSYNISQFLNIGQWEELCKSLYWKSHLAKLKRYRAWAWAIAEWHQLELWQCKRETESGRQRDGWVRGEQDKLEDSEREGKREGE